MATAAQDAVEVQAEYQSGFGGDGAVALQGGKTAPTYYLKGSGTALTEDELIANLEVNDDGDVVIKEGVELFTAAADDAGEFGAQLDATKVDDTAVQALYEASTTKISTAADGSVLVENEDLAEHFNTDGSLKDTLYAKKSDGTWAEIGAEQIEKFVKVTPGKEAVEAGEEEVEVSKALQFSLHVGSESDDENKITVEIKAMSAEGIGVDKLKTPV